MDVERQLVLRPPPDPTREDWLHVNDVDRIGPGRHLVSVRNANQLLVVERGTDVVEVINEDGDPTVINRQHNPHWLGDGTVLVADSENDRVVEVRRNGTLVASYATQPLPYEADRLPYGDSFGASHGNRGALEDETHGRHLPVLSAVLDGLRHLVPLPHWVAEWQLLVVVATLGLWGWGGGLLVRTVR